MLNKDTLYIFFASDLVWNNNKVTTDHREPERFFLICHQDNDDNNNNRGYVGSHQGERGDGTERGDEGKGEGGERDEEGKLLQMDGTDGRTGSKAL